MSGALLHHMALQDCQFSYIDLARARLKDVCIEQSDLSFAALLETDPARREECLELYRKAFEWNPDSSNLHFNYGRLLASSGEWKAAEPYFRRATELDPLHGPAWNALGVAAMQRGASQEAVAAFERAVATAPERREWLRNLMIACRAAGDIRRAAELERRLAGRNGR